MSPADSRDVAEGALRRLARKWTAPWLAAVTVIFDARLVSSLGRSDGRRRAIRLQPALRRSKARLLAVICHEAAHLVAYERTGGSESRHGPTWRSLMLAAGQDPIARLPKRALPKGSSRTAGRRYEHRCPVCQFRRFAARPMRTWRCASCAADGLSGALEITRLAKGVLHGA